MKKIISGARYNTDTAKLIAKWEQAQHQSGFAITFVEALYRAKTGKWFLHSKVEGTVPSEQITPLSEDAAFRWAELHLSSQQVEQIFSSIGAEITQVAAYLPADLLAKLDAEKASSGRSRSDIIIDALRKYL